MTAEEAAEVAAAAERRLPIFFKTPFIIISFRIFGGLILEG